MWSAAKWTESALASVSMGYQIGVTPLQMVSAVSAVGHGGELVEPRVIRAVYRDSRRYPVQPKTVRRVIDEVRERAGEPRGFGSVRVRARVGATTWDTSVFPDAASGSFALPVKKSVRTAAGVAEGDMLTVTVSVRDGA